MDHHSRGIIRALLAVLILAAAAFAASLFVSYNVTFDATITALEGDAVLIIPNRAPRPLSQNDGEHTRLRVNHTLQLEPGSRAVITFAINGGRADIEGPASFKLVESQRTATTIGHVRASGAYSLIVEQDGGTARYYFDEADPPLDESDVTIRITDITRDEIVLTEPCWLATASADGTTVSRPFACP